MTDAQQTTAPATDDRPTWGYFVVFNYTNRYGSGSGNQFITCYAPVDADGVREFHKTIARTAEPGTQGITVTFFTLVSEPATAPADLVEIAVQAAARESAKGSPAVNELAAQIAADPVFRARIAAGVTALAAAGRLR